MGRPVTEDKKSDRLKKTNLQGKGRKIGRHTSETPLPLTSTKTGWQKLSTVCVFVCFKPSTPAIAPFNLRTKTAIT